jgi:hypothetical protein
VSEPSDTTAAEAELRRRLGDLATLATVDDAWDDLQRRLADAPATGHLGRFRGVFRSPDGRPSRSRRVIAVAAAVAVVVGLIALSRDGRHDRTETVDTTTTTVDRGTTSTTTGEQGATTTTGGDRPGEVTGSSVPSPGQGGGPGGGETSTGTPDGNGGPGTTPAPPGDGGDPGTVPPPSTPTAPSGDPIAASIPHGGGTMDISAYESGGNVYVDLWRNGTEYLTMTGWALAPGRNCLAVDPTVDYDGELDSVRWGIVRADAAAVQIVTTTGERTTATLGPPRSSGVRAWLGPRPAGQVDHYLALAGNGATLHSLTVPEWEAAGEC